MFKKLIQLILQKYVIQYFQAHPEVRLIVVVGSVGKTSTKNALAHIVEDSKRVRMHSGNHNTDISAPLAMLGVEYPTSLKNPMVWLGVFKKVRAKINEPADVDVIIQELGVDQPGDMKQFTRYLNPDIAIVTAITPEHMLHFTDLADVAKEELLISETSRITLVNSDDTPGDFMRFISKGSQVVTYGTGQASDYNFKQANFSVDQGFVGTLTDKAGSLQAEVSIKALGKHSTLPVIGAIAASHLTGISIEQASLRSSTIPTVSGRMNVLRGVDGSMIIDDTYNSSPAALRAALETLFTLPGGQKVAILGSMNELGGSSREEHEAIGSVCTPDKLDILITVGEDANNFLATAAKESGCVVHQAWNSKEAGEKAKELVIPNAIILAKGSEGGIFIEEAVKFLLEDEADESKLVRQSDSWLSRKGKFFEKNKGVYENV